MCSARRSPSTQQHEPSTQGAALLALEAAGKIGNLETRIVALGTQFEPDMKRHARYLAAVEQQTEFYQQLFSET